MYRGKKRKFRDEVVYSQTEMSGNFTDMLLEAGVLKEVIQDAYDMDITGEELMKYGGLFECLCKCQDIKPTAKLLCTITVLENK